MKEELLHAQIDTKVFRQRFSPIIRVMMAYGIPPESFHLSFDSGGMHVRELDASQIALISMQIKNGEFEEYKWDKLKDSFKVSSRLLKTALCLVDSDVFTLRVVKDTIKKDTEEVDTFEMVFEFNGGVTRFAMAQDTEYAPPKIPNIKYKAKVEPAVAEINPEKFAKTINKLKSVRDFLSINIGKKESYLSVSDDDELNAKIPFSRVGTVSKVSEDVRSMFSISYFKEVLSPELRRIKSATIHVGDSCPILIEFPTEHKGINGKIQYWLAPRVENE